MKTYTVDKNGKRHEVDWHDFMTNDDNPTLQRLADELLQDEEFQAILEGGRLYNKPFCELTEAQKHQAGLSARQKR